jgi:endo-1,4-beta-xylanase
MSTYLLRREDELVARYKDIFQTFIKHQKSIVRVTFLGVTDGDSLLNGWPVVGRTNFPLLFNRDGKAKKSHDEVLALALK